jgi:hypothetical protein
MDEEILGSPIKLPDSQVSEYAGDAGYSLWGIWKCVLMHGEFRLCVA